MFGIEWRGWRLYRERSNKIICSIISFFWSMNITCGIILTKNRKYFPYSLLNRSRFVMIIWFVEPPAYDNDNCSSFFANTYPFPVTTCDGKNTNPDQTIDNYNIVSLRWRKRIKFFARFMLAFFRRTYGVQIQQRTE